VTGPTPRVAIVTGGTRGLGAAVATRLNAQGVRVVAVYRSDDEAAAKLQHGVETPALLDVRRADVSDPEACTALSGSVFTRYGRIDHLVNNAGSLDERLVAEITPDGWERSLRANLSTAFHMTQAVLEPMRRQRFGRIVNVSSVTAVMGSAFQLHYAAAKSGLIGLTRSLARATARRGITVNCVLPGGFETEMLDQMSLTDRAQVENLIPVGRFGHPDELAHVVAALLHDDASYVTGAVIPIDGGLGMGA